MQYTINEGKLELTQTWQDQSANVLVPVGCKVKGANLVIARDAMPLGSSLSEYVEVQKTAFIKQLKNFSLQRENIENIQNKPVHFLDFTWLKDGKEIYQIINVRELTSPSLLCFTGTIPGGYDAEVFQLLMSAIQSFVPKDIAQT
jgi:hypothetical protein